MRSMTYSFPTADVLTSAEEVALLDWDLLGPVLRLDFGRPFMPEALARTAALAFLAPEERRALNLIRGNAHLTIMALLDELVGPGRQGGPRAGVSVHGELLRRFRRAFVDGFGAVCETIGPVAPLAAHHASAPPLARAVLGEHVTWMAKRHVQAAVLNARTLDPAFAGLLMQHWVERAPRAAGTVLQATEAAPSEIDAAIAGYRRLCAGLSEAMQTQALLDMAALERVRGRALPAEAREQTLLVQHHAYWWSYIGTGLTHPRFAASLRRLAPGALSEFDGIAAVLG